MKVAVLGLQDVVCFVRMLFVKDEFVCLNRDQETVHAIVEKLGKFEIAKTVSDSTTHIVSGAPRRTVNILAGTAKGCWILSLEWVSTNQCMHNELPSHHFIAIS